MTRIKAIQPQICATGSFKSPGCNGGDWAHCGSNTYPTGSLPAVAKEAGIAAETQLIDAMGTPVGELIIKVAKEWPADLIVCGTHGRRGVRRIVMGSDAEYIVRHTPVPVLLIRQDAPYASAFMNDAHAG
jgi:hypothetical protein